MAEVRATLFPPAACEGEVADRFEGGGQIDLGELGAALEGRVADDGEGGGQGDLAEGGAVVEGAIWDGYLCRKQAGSASSQQALLRFLSAPEPRLGLTQAYGQPQPSSCSGGSGRPHRLVST